MPEIIELSGLGDGEAPVTDALVVIGLLAAVGAAVYFLAPKEPESAFLGDLGIIRKCRKRDRKSGVPVKKQQWCLWTSDGKRILGRHPTKKAALRQERLIQMKKHGG